MRNFNDDDFGDFFDEWEKFNHMMNNNRSFKNEMTEILRKMMDSSEMGGSFDFRIIPMDDKKFYGFNIPEDGLKTEKGSDENGDWESKHWESPDGSWSYTSFSRHSTPEDSRYIPRKKRWNSSDFEKLSQEEIDKVKLGRLQKSLDLHVEREEYEKAAEIKKLMDEIKSKAK